jgi:hypothetical protein
MKRRKRRKDIPSGLTVICSLTVICRLVAADVHDLILDPGSGLKNGFLEIL